MTTIDKKGNVAFQIMEVYSDRKEANIFAAIAKEFFHLISDLNTDMGLPAPLMGLFNLLQFGNITKENLTIAEIVQGMYYEGYDFIHFCSMSIPVMVTEVIVRICYFAKRVKEENSVRDSIPFSLDRTKNPKLSTMLFIGHFGAAAINAGKVCFTKNPIDINYPQWIAFGKYSYTQLKWVIYEKPRLREDYVKGIINEELYSVYQDIDTSFDSATKNYQIIMR
jgi:hypothetical protein